MKRIAAALGLLLLAGSGASAQSDESSAKEKVTPLFASDERLNITLTGPIKTIVNRAERSMDPHPARLQAAGESHAISLSARGKSRRKGENCKFPPLRIEFSAKPAETSLFHKQGGIKLVTHCSTREKYDQYVLREYAMYRLYSVVTPESLKVRLAQVTYLDDGDVVAARPGFLIEDADDAARRLGVKEVDIGNIGSNLLNREAAARFAMFQYMIGNTDWAMVVGPDPTDCCHNSKLLGESKSARRDLTPVPYDFDNSGMVDAPYAYPNAALGTNSVRTRVYRGFCSLNSLVPGEIERLRRLRPQFEAEIRAIPGLEQRTREDMLRYLDGYYKSVADERSVKRNIYDKCR
ncbi:hypothetical protein [Erythrobacter sp. HKB08]|uniref:hypothetical protein n=1 Tax=Erythrobacter sp. HKB08 TaxID=2502843 RepID=UPI0010092519|nr:hypothetical protein [Erythrobacter sp. HKB08]